MESASDVNPVLHPSVPVLVGLLSMLVAWGWSGSRQDATGAFAVYILSAVTLYCGVQCVRLKRAAAIVLGGVLILAAVLTVVIRAVSGVLIPDFA